jgi:hypothetical protein
VRCFRAAVAAFLMFRLAAFTCLRVAMDHHLLIKGFTFVLIRMRGSSCIGRLPSIGQG